MVRDAYHYALPMLGVAVLLAWLAGPYWAILPLLLTVFFLWFFRDPNRLIPDTPGAVVSPADGKVTDISVVEWDGLPRTRISIFLNIFDVHVNRTPIPGKVTCVSYKKGQFLPANKAEASDSNEQSVITVDGVVGGVHTTGMFKQIAGLIARRIICYKKAGDILDPGERVGLIKFGSRVDVFLGPEWELTVHAGDRVSAGSSVIARVRETGAQPL